MSRPDLRLIAAHAPVEQTCSFSSSLSFAVYMLRLRRIMALILIYLRSCVPYRND
jgi:hypothetical protein